MTEKNRFMQYRDLLMEWVEADSCPNSAPDDYFGCGECLFCRTVEALDPIYD